MTKRILVTGSREWDMQGWLYEVLRDTYREFERDAILIHGGAKGADQMAHEMWATKVGEDYIDIYEPDYDKYPRNTAPLERNKVMVDLKPDVVLAFQTQCFKPKCKDKPFHYSHGTQNTIDLALDAGLEVRIFRDPPF